MGTQTTALIQKSSLSQAAYGILYMPAEEAALRFLRAAAAFFTPFRPCCKAVPGGGSHDPVRPPYSNRDKAPETPRPSRAAALFRARPGKSPIYRTSSPLG